MSPLDNIETALYTQKHKDAHQFRSMMQGPHIFYDCLDRQVWARSKAELFEL